MFELFYKIVIGGQNFSGVNEVIIKRSISTLAAFASIKVPATAIHKQTDGTKNNVLTAQSIKRGDKVTIELGYNGILKKEFSGYVTRVNFTKPVEIECTDSVFLLREKTIKKSYPEKKGETTTLTKVLTDLTKDIKTHENNKLIFDTGGLEIDITNLLLATDTGGEVTREEALQYILDRYGLVGYFDTIGTLFVGLRQGKKSGTAKYKIGYNTIKDDDLKYHESSEQKIKIKAIYINKLGERTELEVGDNEGSTKTVFLTDVSDATQLQTLAQNELLKYKFDGYSGKITAFLQPFSEPGTVCEIIDPQYSQRSGNYYCEGIEVNFGMSGARRKIEIGAKV